MYVDTLLISLYTEMALILMIKEEVLIVGTGFTQVGVSSD